MVTCAGDHLRLQLDLCQMDRTVVLKALFRAAFTSKNQRLSPPPPQVCVLSTVTALEIKTTGTWQAQSDKPPTLWLRS